MIEEVVVGEITGAFGIKGWVKVRSFTEPRSNILSYSPWRIRKHLGPGDCNSYEIIDGTMHGVAIVVSLQGINDREAALGLKGGEIVVSRTLFPKLDKDVYYWADLIGSSVETIDSIPLGAVTGMMETGANDVLVVLGERERLIPFVIPDFVKEVDLGKKRIVVNWDPDF